MMPLILMGSALACSWLMHLYHNQEQYGWLLYTCGILHVMDMSLGHGGPLVACWLICFTSQRALLGYVSKPRLQDVVFSGQIGILALLPHLSEYS